MSNRFPANGIAPTPTSIARFTTIRATVTIGTPRKNAARTMMQLANPPRKSPIPGMNPTMPSRPKRIDVPGTRNHVSSTRESRSRFSSRKVPPAPRNRGFSCPESTMPGGSTSPYPIFVVTGPCSLRPDELDATINSCTAAIVQWQNAALWQRMSWVRTPLAAPISPLHRASSPQPLRPIFARAVSRVCCEINLAARRKSSRASHPTALCPESLRRHLRLGLSLLETGLLPAKITRALIPQLLRLAAHRCRGQLHLPRVPDEQATRKLAGCRFIRLPLQLQSSAT